MASVIKLKRSATPGAVPSSLAAGEVAINTADKKLFSSDGSTVFNIAGDLYNAVTQANSGTGGADIVLTVDNDTLSNDAIELVGGTGVSVTRNANGAIIIGTTGSGNAAGLTSAVTVALAGDVTGSATFQNAGDTATITTTIADNSLELGTATTGSYVESLVAGSGIVLSNNSGESATPTIAINDGITANTSGTAAKATILATARTIGGVSFDGSANINLPGVNAAGNQDTTGNAATATRLAGSGVNIGGVPFNGTININLPGVDVSGTQDTSGNAGTATKLATARDIGGVSFDGSANIDLPGVNQTGNQNTTGSAATLTTARAIALAGDVVGTANFDGSAGISITTAIQPNSVALGTDTTGNYVATVTGTAGEIEVSGSGSETAGVQIGLPNDVTIGNDLSVTGNASCTGGLTVGGNLEVNGTMTFIDSTTVTIGDNMLKLANNNVADTVDTGFYVQYNDGTEKFAGLVRDATNGEFNLFTELTTEPNQTINFAATTTTATLNANIDGGTY